MSLRLCELCAKNLTILFRQTATSSKDVGDLDITQRSSPGAAQDTTQSQNLAVVQDTTVNSILEAARVITANSILGAALVTTVKSNLEVVRATTKWGSEVIGWNALIRWSYSGQGNMYVY